MIEFLGSVVLPLVAVAISIGTLIWTALARRADQARIAIETTLRITLRDDEVVPIIIVEATNVGRSARTVLHSIRLRLAGGPTIGLDLANEEDYPQPLEPGARYRAEIDSTEVAELCLGWETRPKGLQVEVVTGHEIHLAPFSAMVQRTIDDAYSEIAG